VSLEAALAVRVWFCGSVRSRVRPSSVYLELSEATLACRVLLLEFAVSLELGESQVCGRLAEFSAPLCDCRRLWLGCSEHLRMVISFARVQARYRTAMPIFGLFSVPDCPGAGGLSEYCGPLSVPNLWPTFWPVFQGQFRNQNSRPRASIPVPREKTFSHCSAKLALRNDSLKRISR
jgi:hypothetical protein